MDFLPKEIDRYSELHTQHESKILKKLNRETNTKVLKPRMLSGHIQGRVLSMLSHMIKPNRILEIGTYTGYSAICLAEGLTATGRIITIDRNVELKEMVLQYFSEAGIIDNVDYLLGDAMELIHQINEPLDMVFIDADKINYYNYYNLVFDKVRSGGFIIADNVLWSGKVIKSENKIDKDTQAIIDFNRLVHEDDRVENVLVPIRDGLMVLRKK
jgi:predicted O-methyltransferase YrrM